MAGSNWKIGIVAFAACAPVVVIVIVIGCCIVCLLKKRGQQRGKLTKRSADCYAKLISELQKSKTPILCQAWKEVT